MKWSLVWGPMLLSGVQVTPDASVCSWQAKDKEDMESFDLVFRSTGTRGLLPAGQDERTRPALRINQLCTGKDDNGAATPSVHLMHPLSTGGATLVVKVNVRGLYIAMVQYSSFCVSAVVLTLGVVDIEDGVPRREQEECGREEVNDGEKQERETDTEQRTNAQTHNIMDDEQLKVWS